MGDQVTMIDSQTISVSTQVAQTYNINDLTTQANNITQNILTLQASLNTLNGIIVGAQTAGVTIPNLVSQVNALPSGADITTLLGAVTAQPVNPANPQPVIGGT